MRRNCRSHKSILESLESRLLLDAVGPEDGGLNAATYPLTDVPLVIARGDQVEPGASQSLLAQSASGHVGDSILSCGPSGYAELSDASVDDLDYSRSFTAEGIFNIDMWTAYGRWSAILCKGAFNVGYYNSPGFYLGLFTGDSPTMGHEIVARVNGGGYASITSPNFMGTVYATMVWDADVRELSLYVNGDEYVHTTGGAAITPTSIENNDSLRVGKGYRTYQGDIFMTRLWNRALSSGEVQTLWSNFHDDGREQLPAGFDTAYLHSECLMSGMSDASGNPGTTHLVDTAGDNHLQLKSGAALVLGDGPAVLTPADGATGVDKSVVISVEGGMA